MKIEFFKIIRKRTIECVLSTDMAFHSKIFGQISSKLTYFQQSKTDKTLLNFFNDQTNNCSKFDLQQEFLNYVLHIGDIAHPAKPWNIELKWSDLIYKEFFNQGDKEKSLKINVSFLCDRETTSVPKSQVGFIKNIILPSFSLILAIMPLSEEMNKYVVKNLEKWMLCEDEENKNNDININSNNNIKNESENGINPYKANNNASNNNKNNEPNCNINKDNGICNDKNNNNLILIYIMITIRIINSIIDKMNCNLFY